jgi:YesN/AraC family two-component response regulator
MSGEKNSPRDVDTSIDKGCDDFLIKPLIKNSLRKKVDTIVENIIQKRMLKSERNIRSSFENRFKRNTEKIRSMAKQISEVDLKAYPDTYFAVEFPSRASKKSHRNSNFQYYSPFAKS